MNETEKYKLKKPEQNDFYNVEDFNHNADVIDAALTAHDESLADLAAYIGYTAPDIYGVEVDFENNRFTRLAGTVGLLSGTDFDNIAPWQRRRCNVTHDGTVTAYSGDEGYTETGFTTTEITPEDSMAAYPVGTPVNVMVEQPPFYYKFIPLKLEKVGEGKYAIRKARYYVSAKPKEGFELHPVFLNAERAVYFAAYESCIYNTDETTYEAVPDAASIDVTAHRLASVSGKNVILSDRPFTGYEDAAGIGAIAFLSKMLYGKYDVLNEDALSATQLLFLIEYASFDSQANIGKGVKDNSLNSTGSTSGLGNASGAAETGAVSYRGEENLWGHRWWTTGQTLSDTSSDGGYISAFLYKYKNTQQADNMLLGENTVSSLAMFYNIAEALGDSAKPVGDIFKRDTLIVVEDAYILHGGISALDGILSGSESGLFALYHTPNSAEAPFTVRLFYSDRNESLTNDSSIRDTDFADSIL